MKLNHLILISLVTLGLFVGIFEFYLNSQGKFLTEKIQTLWGLAYVIITIMWASNDAKEKEIHRPFDFGFLMYVFWPLAFPYYLFTTRGMDGIIWVLGFLFIWAGPFLAGLVAYTYA